MIYEEFLTLKGKDFKGRTLEDIWSFSDKEIEEVGKEIRSTVLKWTGIPTSIGIAKTKTLSKVANHITKKTKAGVT